MAIFQRLSQGAMAVHELAERLPVSRPAVSQHLRVLKDAGLVTDRRDGTRRLYQLDPEGVARLRAHFDQVWERALGGFERAAETTVASPVLSQKKSTKKLHKKSTKKLPKKLQNMSQKKLQKKLSTKL